MSLFLKGLSVVAGGVLLGLFVTWLTIVRGAGMGGDVTDGPWRTSLLTGSTEGGMALRATIALHGLFALNRKEAIYYTAVTDSDGKPLHGGCRYTITGRDPIGGLRSRSSRQPIRLRPSGYGAAASSRSASEGWWSITAYGADDFLIPNKFQRYSVSKTSVVRGADGRFTVTASKDASAANQIATGDGAFSLTLRLYNPDPSVADDPAHVALPEIRRSGCP